MKLNSTLNATTTFIALFVLIGLLASKNSNAQVCTNPSTIIYGLTSSGEIREVNMNTAATGAVIKSTTYTGNSPSSANGLAYNWVNGKFYYFKRNVTKTPQEFVSFQPSTGTVTILASSTCTDDVHTGCVTASGTGYYTVDIDGNLSYYNITNNTWTFITGNIVDQYGNDVDAIIRSQSAGDMAVDGYNNIWLVTSSNTNYGLYKFPASLPTTAVSSFTVTRVIAPTATTPTGNSFAGIAFNPSGNIYMSTRSDNKLYKMNNNFTLSFVGNLSTSDIGNDLTSCSFPMGILPVSWNKFEVAINNKNIITLDWEVTEENSKGFYIEHSLNGDKWEDVAFVQSKHESFASYSYSHTNNLNGKQYYRIRQVDMDGKENYSAIKIVSLKNDSRNISIWPNPTKDNIRIVNDGSNNNVFSKAQVFDLSGRIMVEKKLLPEEINIVNISTLPTGTYVVRVQSNDGTSYNQKISKQ